MSLRICLIVILMFPLLSGSDCGVVVVTPCTMDRYFGRWELLGADNAGQDFAGTLAIFDLTGIQFNIRTRRAFGQSGGQTCYANGSPVSCDAGSVLPEFTFWCARLDDCCGTTITLDSSYRDNQGSATAVATITFTSSRTATFRVESVPARSWGPVTGLLRKSN